MFTLPAAVAEIAFQNKETVYAILFRAAAQALRTIAADPRHLGAEIPANRCRPIDSLIPGGQSGVSDKTPATQSP